ncbi:MAG: VIT1/CCC1 transporter family protein [Pseudomonadota bacterium]
MAEPLEHSHDPDDIAKRLREGYRVSYLSDWIYGGIDGAITTFAIVAGSLGADFSTRVILILGFVNVMADGFSMAAANFSGTKADNDNAERLRKVEERHIRLAPEGERQEIRQIFADKGFAGETLEQVVDVITADKRLWIDTMLTEEHGIALARRSPTKAAFSTFLGFLLCGLVPLMPFLFGLPHAGYLCLALTAAVFFLIGLWKSQWSPQRWYESAVETLIIGLSAAGIAYLLGDVLGRVFA